MALQRTGVHSMTLLQQAARMDYGPTFYRFAYRFCASTIDLRVAPSQQSWSRSICHQSKGAEKQTPLPRFHEAAMMETLEEYIQPAYAKLAFTLPPSSGTFWSFMEGEIERIASEDKHFSTCINQVVSFLARFFSTALVDKVIYNLSLLQESFMGIEYTLREGKALVALNVLRDVQAFCDVEGSPLHGFYGHVPSDDEGDAPIQEVEPRPLEGESRTLQTGGGGAGNGMGSGTSGGSGDVESFSILDDKSVIVPLPPFAELSFGDPNRVETIKRRSGLFFFGAGAQEQIYNPHDSQSGKLPLFHGMRQSCLPDFKQRGIDPPSRPNEFSRDAAFYVSNSLRQVYEHPLHYHPARNIIDPICVLVFELDIAVLHGLKPPRGSNSPLNCCWFPDTAEATAEWQAFCEGNYSGKARRHNFDIVIGPFCLPTKIGPWRKLWVEMPYNVPLTQVAFCSVRAWEWLESSFKKAYMESFV